MSDIEKIPHAMVYDTMLQHLSTFQELLPQLQDDESKMLAFSSLPLYERDIESVSYLLLHKVTILVPYTANPKLLLDLKLRLDSM